MSVVRVERHSDERIAVLTLDRPPLNAIDEELALGLAAATEQLEADRDTWVVLVESACEGIFGVGADLTVIETLEPEDVDRATAVQDIVTGLALLRQPTVCAINGHALGGGFEIALACDFRLMARGDGLVGLPEARLGLLPGAGGTQRLTQLVGPARATMMIMKGLQLSAEEALAEGLVHELVEPDQLGARARDFAVRLARQAPLALQAVKRAVAAASDSSGFEVEKAGFRELLLSEDAKAGARAFLAGEKPEFTGR